MEDSSIAKQRLRAEETRNKSTELKREFLIGFALFFGACSVFLFWASSAFSAQATLLIISPGSRSLTEGERFSIDILVSSPNQAINAAEGKISFPPDKLQAIAVSDNGSVFNLWVKEPSFSNSLGTIDFSGIVLNPGFTGKIGKIFTVSFEARAQGSAPVAFANGALLASDGNGTNILSEFRHANYFISPSVIITPVKPVKAVPQKKKPTETPEKPEESPSPPEVAVAPQAEPLIYVIQPANTSKQLANQLMSLAILLALLFIVWYLWRRSFITNDELEMTETNMHNRLDILRQDIKRRVQHLEELDSKQGLTSEEREILQELREELIKTAWPNR